MKKTLIGIVAAGILSSCSQTEGWFGSNTDSTANGNIRSENSYTAKLARDESITRENAYSDLFLDSAALENFLRKENMSGDKAESMRAFYRVRNNQFAWFTSDGLTEQARGLWSLSASEEGKKGEPAEKIRERMDSLLTGDSLLASGTDTARSTRTAVTSQKMAASQKTDTSQARRDTMQATAARPQYSAGDSTIVNTELALTAQLVHLAAENNGIVTQDNFYWLVPRKKMDALQLADSLLNKQTDSTTGASNPQYAALKKTLSLYYNAAKGSGWTAVPSAAGLKKGSKSPAVVLLKKRLAATGDYPAGDTSNLFTDTLARAVKAVQEQYGLKPTGTVTDSLVHELNVPAQERLQQILVNMNRVLWSKPVKDSSHIMVNIPSLQLVVYTDSGKRMEMPVIVGKEGIGTIAFSGEISQVVFSPYWNIPKSIVHNEIKPAMQKDPDYLKKRNMEIVKPDDSLPQIRQLPGKENALGRVKFLFPNSFDIFLHDTPNKELFAQKNRALSHGCIRVARPDSLARFILQDQPEWTPEKIATAMNAGKEQKVDVKKPVPVVITYYTAWTDEKGRMNFRKDVYGYDKKTTAKMFTNAPRA